MTKRIITVELLDEIVSYIGDMEERIDSEWGECRNMDEIISDGDMPELYFKLIKLLEEWK